MATTAADVLIDTIMDWKGEPNGTKIAWTVLSDKVRELI